MTRIASMPPTPAYRQGWERIFGGKKKREHWYRLRMCYGCRKICQRVRVYGKKPKKRTDRIEYGKCSECALPLVGSGQ